MIKMLMILIVLVYSLQVFAIPEDQKMNACFITINSSEEKEEFKKALKSGPNKGKFNFHEFVPEISDANWFKKACEKKIRCDILVISGHFGGSFFGKYGVNLGLKELEKNSCKNTCEGILSSPKEVFLMGCNTLAGKDEDNRTAGEYLQILLDDGISLSNAQHIVEQRYGALGSSFSSSMRRSFKNVPHIYGFHSVGPSGANVQFLLRNYLKKTKNYYQHIMRIEMERTQALKGKFEQWNKENKKIAQSLKSTNFTQTSGLLMAYCDGNKKLDPDDPNYELMQNLCNLIDDKMSEENKIQLITDLLKRDDFELYVNHISDLLRSNENINKKIKEFITKDKSVSNKLVGLIDVAKTGVSKLAIAKLLWDLDIYNQEKYENLEKEIIVNYLKMPVTVNAKDSLCSLTSQTLVTTKISLEDLDPKIFSSKMGVYALSCLEYFDESLISQLFETLKTTKDSDIQADIYKILSKTQIKDEKIYSFFHEKAQSKKLIDKALALRTLYFLDRYTEEELFEMKQLLHSSKKIKIHNEVMEMTNIFQDLYEDMLADETGETPP